MANDLKDAKRETVNVSTPIRHPPRDQAPVLKTPRGPILRQVLTRQMRKFLTRLSEKQVSGLYQTKVNLRKVMVRQHLVSSSRT